MNISQDKKKVILSKKELPSSINTSLLDFKKFHHVFKCDTNEVSLFGIRQVSTNDFFAIDKLQEKLMSNSVKKYIDKIKNN